MRSVFLVLLLCRALDAGVPEDVQKIAIGQKMIVILPDGQERYGRLGRTGSTDFDLNEETTHQRVTFRYDEVKKVLQGYGGRTINGGRAHLGRSRVIAIVVVGSLVALAFIAAVNLK